MTAKYYSQLTAAGLAELAAATIANQAVPFTHIDIGDGGGAFVTPDDTTTGLVRKVHRAAISSIKPHPDHANWFVAEAAVPENVGGWTARELALIGGRAGNMVMGVSNYPAVEKVVPEDGTGRAMIVRFYFAYANAAAISLYVSPAAYATAQSVIDSIASHAAAADPHPIYLTKAEADAFYDSIGLAADAIQQDAARLSAHLAAADPHPQYMTSTEVDTRFRADRAKRYFYTSF